MALNDHLKAIIKELEACPPGPPYVPFHAASLQALKECSAAIDIYFINQDYEAAEKTIIGSLLDFLQRWDMWLAARRYPDFSHPSTKIFHEFLLRFAKGAVKQWRIWRIDRQGN